MKSLLSNNIYDESQSHSNWCFVPKQHWVIKPTLLVPFMDYWVSGAKTCPGGRGVGGCMLFSWHKCNMASSQTTQSEWGWLHAPDSAAHVCPRLCRGRDDDVILSSFAAAVEPLFAESRPQWVCQTVRDIFQGQVRIKQQPLGKEPWNLHDHLLFCAVISIQRHLTASAGTTSTQQCLNIPLMNIVFLSLFWTFDKFGS